MKLFKKKSNKKPLSDKAKDERKQKTKHIIKVILDILMYGFAILMAFALAVGGACSPKTKTASAYYHSDEGYTSINSVVVNTDSTTTLHYYYDYNYKKTFPKWDTLFDCFGSNSNGNVGLVRLVDTYAIDNITYSFFGVYKEGTTFYYRVYNSSFSSYVNFVTLTQDNTIVNRSDILTGLFNGIIQVKPYSLYSNFYRYISYYFGDLGYNRIKYSFPINVSNLSYLFANSDNTDTTIENNYLFKNDTFPTIDWGGSLPYPSGIYHDEPIFTGAFRSNGTYYTGIIFRFSSVFGLVNGLRIDYYFGGASSISSDDEFYNGYWYLDSIFYVGNGFTTNVWNACSRVLTTNTGAGSNFYYYNFNNVSWVGDTPYSSTSFRDLFVYYANDAFSGLIHQPYNDTFPLLNNLTFADFLNYIGDAYPTNSTGVPTEVSSPFTNVFAWLRGALSGIMPFFGYTLIPGITIGTLIMVPITMSIILFVVNLFKR